MKLTHDELASMTATTRETVTRTLSRFRKDGIIKTHGVALTVLQPGVLQRSPHAESSQRNSVMQLRSSAGGTGFGREHRKTRRRNIRIGLSARPQRSGQ